jgi:hypothetical protein
LINPNIVVGLVKMGKNHFPSMDAQKTSTTLKNLQYFGGKQRKRRVPP